MAKVFVLPDHIASQIAAGEVVERPSSVVKELVENSIDAGATQIEISIGSECRDIRVADNGSGMESDDAVLAFHRHATSKLSSVDDLYSLNTMGFRGEALPSISSVAQITCLTRTATATSGTKIEAADGKVTSIETGCAPGTVMEITDLFYNVPARLKFLKKPSTEFAQIQEVVQSLAVAHPKIMIHLLKDGTSVFKTSGSGRLSIAMTEAGLLSGKEELREVTYTDANNEITICGQVARPTQFRGDRKGILSIVNNRPVRCPLTYKALEYAYSDLIPRGKYPIATIVLTVNPKLVDINVHPTKREIKYSNGNDVYLALQRALVEAIRYPESNSFGSVTNVETTTQNDSRHPFPRYQDHSVTEPVTTYATRTSPSGSVSQLDFSERLAYVPPASRSATTGSASATPQASLPSGWRLIGYLHNTYFLIETPEGLEILEQHIVHERTLYEQLLSSQETPGSISENTQHLVISAPLNLSAEQKAVVQENLPELQNIGFDFEIAKDAVSCTQVPLQLAHKDYATVVQTIIADLATTSKAELALEATKSIACQSAIKNGMHISEPDIVELIHNWYQTPRNDTCPHGRPVRLKFSTDRLFQMFHPA